ncbi:MULTISPECIES: HNH endonuclease signature motif containing protein [Actinomycetes]|uniref:HNH endonuclease signature motif containing protein n=1 Tax=Actinomycetes TaxID=1760 RepID=UPI0006922A6C|nr:MULTISPECIES: HNH endonuclease signature motif containing protein [Actinomycetes]
MLLVEGGTRAIQLAEDLRTVPREVNRRFAQTIADVVELATLRVHEELAVSGDLDKAARIPVVEVSLLLDISRTMAGVYIDNGLQLRDRFHGTRAAFAEGDIGFTHVREIVTALQGVSDELITQLEPEAIVVAQQGLSRAVLRNELDRMVIAADPDGAAERRKAMEPHRDYRSSRDLSGLAHISATITAAEAAELDARVTAIAGTVCTRDRRQPGQRRADAFVAVMRGHQHLDCACERDNCPEKHREPLAAPPKPMVKIHTDAATLAGLIGQVPTIDGYGVIDPALARELAADATWQGLYKEADQFARGRRRQPGVTAPPPGLLPPDGHGGLTEPPPGALTYQPSQALRETIIARDGICRTPGCSTPAAECEIDHVIPFNHADPRSGGWTIEENLAPICRPDHKRKTLGYWIARMHSDRTMTWTTQYGQTYVTRPHGLGR